MARVIGLGGLFFYSKNPEKLYKWYEKNLGLARDSGGAIPLSPGDVAEQGCDMQVFALFPDKHKYFKPSKGPFMLNFQVDDLDGMIKKLTKNKVKIMPERETSEFGKFAWIMDPEGRKIELWQPPA